MSRKTSVIKTKKEIYEDLEGSTFQIYTDANEDYLVSDNGDVWKGNKKLSHRTESARLTWEAKNRGFLTKKFKDFRLAQSVSTDGYNVVMDVEGRQRRKSHFVFIYCNGLLEVPEGKDLDHENGNRRDDRLLNLRTCTPSENALNRAKRKAGPGPSSSKKKRAITLDQPRSKFKNVIWRGQRNKSNPWEGCYEVTEKDLDGRCKKNENGKTIRSTRHCGSHPTEEAAWEAVCQKRREMGEELGEFAFENRC